MAQENTAVPSVDALYNVPQADKETAAPAANQQPAEETQGKAADQKKPEPRREQGRYSRNMNKVTITGTVKRVTHNKEKTTAVMRIRSQATVTTAYYPTVYFFGTHLAPLASQFQEGDRVKVEAMIQSYPKESIKKGQQEVIVVGTSVVKDALTPMVDLYDEEGLRPIESVVLGDINKIELRGRIEKIECRQNEDVRITIRTVRNGRPSIVEYPYVARNTDRFLSNVHVHQYVGAVGTIQTAMVPVDVSSEEQAEASADASVRSLGDRPYVRLRSQQAFLLYELYALDPARK